MASLPRSPRTSTASQVSPHSPRTTSETYVLLSFFAPLPRSIKQIKKAVQVRKHLERNRNDKDSKFRLILIESRIHRLARYYRTKGQLAPTFKYEAASASTMIA
ncbi:hypothetical protein NBRC10512_006007 [Rhodotorula toruloides]|nr:40S ribosomal protein S13 [Rhodotorula toruloides]